jgi:hypothetical protein
MLAKPKAVNRSIGDTTCPNAATKTHSDAASSNQLAAAQPTARARSRWSSMSMAKRRASRSSSEVKRSASRNRMWADTPWMIRLARCWPRVSK